MAEDKKNPKEASNIFHSIMKASVKPKKVETERPLVKQLIENLNKDLINSIGSNKVELYIENDFIVVKLPIDDDFIATNKYLTSIINNSMTKQGANRVAVKITNGKDENILSWGF
jgi:hypothetical protein